MDKGLGLCILMGSPLVEHPPFDIKTHLTGDEHEEQCAVNSLDNRQQWKQQ